jgi:hypothetical protein
MTKTPAAFMFPCDLCGSAVQMGPHAYKGRTWPHYKMLVCNLCHDANWDGIAPSREQVFERHLNLNGIPLPPRNEKGWYPRDP